MLNDGLRKTPGLRLTQPPVEYGHAYYKYYVFIDSASLHPDWNQEQIITAINAEGIPCFSGSCGEIYLEQAFRCAGLGPRERLPQARRLAESSLMLLVHPTLTDVDMRDTCMAVDKVMRAATADGRGGM